MEPVNKNSGNNEKRKEPTILTVNELREMMDALLSKNTKLRSEINRKIDQQDEQIAELNILLGKVIRDANRKPSNEPARVSREELDTDKSTQVPIEHWRLELSQLARAKTEEIEAFRQMKDTGASEMKQDHLAKEVAED